MDAYRRRTEIKETLLSGVKVTTGELMKKYGVSKPTIINDLNYITKQIKLTSSCGRNGGYMYLGPKLMPPITVRTFQELHQCALASGAEFSRETAAEVQKLLKLLENE